MHDCLEEVEERGYKFYVNSKTKIKYKENPSLILIIKQIKTSFSDVKYSCYRSAIKIIRLKRELYTFSIPFRCAISIITKHKSGSSQDVSPSQLTDIIHDIFFANEKAGFYVEHKKFHLDKAISIFVNLLWNIFDPKRQQNISLMELQLAMLILCELPPINTYHQLIDAHFNIVKDHNNCITRPRFEEFINIFGKILSYLGEPLYFERKTVSEIVNEVFETYTGLNGMSQFTFTTLWTSHDNSAFSTYTNLFLLIIRFIKSEQVIHQHQCSSCHAFPIVGMRFKCLKCRGLSLCFNCFSKQGFVNQSHSLAHRMLELNSNEKERGKFCKFLLSLLKIFRPQTIADSPSATIASTFDGKHKTDGDSKLIEDSHVQLSHIEDDMEGGICGQLEKRRGTMRSEVFNNSENLLIIQRNLMEKLLSAIMNIKLESEKCQKTFEDNKSALSTVPTISHFVNSHGEFLAEHIIQLRNIHEGMMSSFVSSQNSKTIKSGFASPTTSLFLPHSSTPYRVKRIIGAKENSPLELALCKSINGYELNRSYVADSTDYSISDVSSWFQTKLPKNSNPSNGKKNLADETFETKVANFRHLLDKVKEIIDDSYSDNVELARTTANLESVVAKIIDDEEKKRKA